jgi:phosphoserine phosphatase
MTAYRIVDVCGTLVHDDTTLGLLRWHFARQSRWRLWVLQCLTARWSPARFLVTVAEKVTGRHLLKHGLVRLLKDDAVVDVEKSALQYADWLLAHRRVASVAAVLANSVEQGVLVLASASLQPVVRALSSRLGVDYVASTLETVNGIHLGRYASDLTGRKMAALDARLPPGWRSAGYLAISDNLTDRDLLEGAAHAYVVLHAPRHRARWGDIQAEYLSAC